MKVVMDAVGHGAKKENLVVPPVKKKVTKRGLEANLQQVWRAIGDLKKENLMMMERIRELEAVDADDLLDADMTAPQDVPESTTDGPPGN